MPVLYATRSHGLKADLAMTLRGRALRRSDRCIVAVDAPRIPPRWRSPTSTDTSTFAQRSGIERLDYALANEAVRRKCVVSTNSRRRRRHRTHRCYHPARQTCLPTPTEVRIRPLATHRIPQGQTRWQQTDDIDLGAIHAAAVHGFGLSVVCRSSSNSADWRWHCCDLVGKTSSVLPDPRSSAQPHAGHARAPRYLHV